MTLGRLVDGLQSRQMQVRVIAPARKDRPLDGAVAMTPVRGLPIPRYPELRFGLPAHRRLRSLWQEQRPDIIHIATEGPLGWSAMRVARQLGIPAVSSFHTNFHSYGSHYGYGFLKQAVLRWLRHCHNNTQLTFAPSNDLIATLEADGFRNLRLLARGVDTRLFGPHRRNPQLRRKWQVGQDQPVAIYVGRLAAEKNLALVERAYRSMLEQIPDLRLVLVGDGPERARLQRDLPQAIFAGMQIGTDLAEHYASADCFLFASITETFGNVVTEAMASGLAVLAYNYAAPGRFIEHGRNGLLAEFNAAEDFVAQAQQLAANRDEWPLLGRAARETLLPHSWDGIVEGYLRDLGPVLEQKD